jgi:uncharacterized protein DUF6152
MKYRIGTALFVFVSVVLTTLPLLAHHGTAASYDNSKTVTIKGTVAEYRFANPHVQIFVDVKDANGQTVHWGIEGSSVYYWSKAGWNKDSLKIGTEVTVILNPSRAGTPYGVMQKLVMPDGKEMTFADGR